MTDLRSSIIRLAKEHPEFRASLIPLLRGKTAASDATFRERLGFTLSNWLEDCLPPLAKVLHESGVTSAKKDSKNSVLYRNTKQEVCFVILEFSGDLAKRPTVTATFENRTTKEKDTVVSVNAVDLAPHAIIRSIWKQTPKAYK